MLRVLLIAGSVGLDNFAASTAIGISGVDRRLRLRLILIIGLFESAMPLIGLLIGRGLSGALGGADHLIGGGLLIAVGAHATWEALSGGEGEGDLALAGQRMTRLLLLGLALSIDNLVVGFALGADHGALLLSVVAITVAGVTLSLLGLELGARLGPALEQRGELLGGLILIGVGVAILVNVI